jgi:hypothetical protein
MISASDTFINAMQSPLTQVYIKLELYNSSYEYISEITKEVQSDLGTLNISVDSPIRRSFSLSLDNSLGEFIFGESNLIWIDKRLKLYLGLKTWKNDVEYIPLGVFVLTQPQNQHTLQKNNTTINAVDKAYFLTDNRGKFVNNVTIQTGAKITDSIRLIASEVGETMFNFDDVQDTVPYELTYSGSDNRWKALQELATLAKCEIFYDVYGYLRLRKIDLEYFDNEPISWSYVAGDPNEKFYAGTVRQLDDTNLFNDIVVLGGSSDTATCSYRLTVDETNPIWAGHPYSVQKIGWSTFLWNNGNPDGLLTSNDDCKFRAKYELMHRLGFTEKVQLTIFPNYLHDVSDVVFLSDPINGIEGSKYIIQQINLPLAPSQMTMNVVKYNRVISDWNFI